MNFRHSIIQSFTFHAAHRLAWHAGKCANLHGHTYRCELRITAGLNENGIVVDFDDVTSTINRLVLEQLDHTDLNELFENPTAELVAQWIYEQVAVELDGLDEVRLWETPESSAVVSRA